MVTAFRKTDEGNKGLILGKLSAWNGDSFGDSFGADSFADNCADNFFGSVIENP